MSPAAVTEGGACVRACVRSSALDRLPRDKDSAARKSYVIPFKTLGSVLRRRSSSFQPLHERVSDHANPRDGKARKSANSLPLSTDMTSSFLPSFLPEADRRCQVRGHKACGKALLQTCKFLFTGWEFSLSFI